MYNTTNDVKSLAGLAWDEFFRLVDHHHYQQAKKQSVLLSVQPKSNVAVLPHKKATCYGTCSVTETPKLVKCQSCSLVVKTVAFGHHQKIHHSHFFSPTRRSISSDSDSDDDCQGFLLSPPHHPTSTVPSSSEKMLDLKFVEDTKWTISDSLKKLPSIGARNANDGKNAKTLRHSPPRYDVQRRNDLRLVLTKRRSSFTKTRVVHKAIGDHSRQSTPLVSISITRPGGHKQNCVEISAPKQTIKADKAKGSAIVRINAKEKCNKSMEWATNVHLSEDIFTADLDESEQSSIPLHHSPSESSDSDTEAIDQRDIEPGKQQLLEHTYLPSTHDFVREKQCPPLNVHPMANTAGWNPRNAAERPSTVNKPNNMALRHKMQQRKEVIRQKNETAEQSFGNKRTVRKGRGVRQTEKSSAADSAGMDVVVEKLFTIHGISMVALDPDGKRKMALPKQRHHIVPSTNGQTEEGKTSTVRTDPRTRHHQFPNNEKGSAAKGHQKGTLPSFGHRQQAAKSSLFQARVTSPPIASPSSVPTIFSPNVSSFPADETSAASKNWDLQILETTTTTDESSERQNSGRNSPVNCQRNGTFAVKNQKAQRKMSTATFAGVSWHKLDSHSVASAHGQPNVPEVPNAICQKGSSFRFVPLLNSTNENVAEQCQEDQNSRARQKRIAKTTPTRGPIARHFSNSTQVLLTDTPCDGSDHRPLDFDSRNQSPEFVCHIRPGVHSSADGSPTTGAFFGQNPNRKRSFMLQHKTPNHQMPQQPIGTKRFRPIASRKNEPALRVYAVEDSARRAFPTSDFVQSPRSCAAAGVSSQQPNLPCRPSHAPQIFDQRFHPKVPGAFSSPPSADPFGDAVQVHGDDQLSPSSADFRTFGRQPFAAKSHQQSHHHQMRQSLHTPLQQSSPFDTLLGDDHSYPSKFYGPQFGAAHGPSTDFGGAQQRIIPPEYSSPSPQMVGKMTAPCAHLQHQCQPYGAQLVDGVASAMPYSSQQSLFRHSHDELPHCPSAAAFLFAASPAPHPSASSSFNGIFPPVRHHPSDPSPLTQAHQQQHFLLQQAHFHPHPLAVLPAPQCRHNCGAAPPHHQGPPSPSVVHGPFSACRGGGAFAGMASPHAEPFFLPPSYAFQQCQLQQFPHRFMRSQLHQQQLQHQTRVVSYGASETDPEIFAIEPPPVLEAEGNISASEEGAVRFEEGGGTTRSDSDASDMDLREILPQQ